MNILERFLFENKNLRVVKIRYLLENVMGAGAKIIYSNGVSYRMYDDKSHLGKVTLEVSADHYQYLINWIS